MGKQAKPSQQWSLGKNSAQKSETNSSKIKEYSWRMFQASREGTLDVPRHPCCIQEGMSGCRSLKRNSKAKDDVQAGRDPTIRFRIEKKCSLGRGSLSHQKSKQRRDKNDRARHLRMRKRKLAGVKSTMLGGRPKRCLPYPSTKGRARRQRDTRIRREGRLQQSNEKRTNDSMLLKGAECNPRCSCYGLGFFD